MAAKRKKKVTLKEFRAWLEGVEELQPPNWSPNAEQWKLIREKIDSIVEEKPKRNTANAATEPEQPRPAPPPPPPPPPGSSILTPPPPVPGGVPPTAIDEGLSPEAAQLLGKTPDGKIKTPDIDTTDGGYRTSFE